MIGGILGYVGNWLAPFFSMTSLFSVGGIGVCVAVFYFGGPRAKILAVAVACVIGAGYVGYIRGDHAGSTRVYGEWDAANAALAAQAKKRDDDIAAAALKRATEALASIEAMSKEELEEITRYAAELASRGDAASCRLTRDDLDRLRALRNPGSQRRRNQ